MTYVDVSAVVGLLGGTRTLRAEVRTVADLNRAVIRGLPLRSLTLVSSRYRPPVRERLERMVVPRTTRARREQTGVLSSEESERLERVARLTALAEHVWEDAEAAHAFLTNPHPLLDGETPIDLAASDLGARRVEDLLWKLEYSLPV